MKLKSVVKTKYQDTIVFDRLMKQLPRVYNFEYMVLVNYEELDTLHYYFDSDEEATLFADRVIQIFTRGGQMDSNSKMSEMNPKSAKEYIDQLYAMMTFK